MVVRRGDVAMIGTVLAVSVLCGLVSGSIEHGADSLSIFSTQLAAVPVPPPPPPIVASSSSQYFQRNFNRLIVPQPVVPVAPAPPIVHAAPAPPVFPFAPAPPVFVQPTAIVPQPVTPVHNEPIPPNIAIAVATAQAAPVATFLLPPYPFGIPPSFGFIPPTPTSAPDESRKETTTPTTTQTLTETTTKKIETTTPITVASNSDNNFVQALPSNQDMNFNTYGPPKPQWPQQQGPQPQWGSHWNQQIPRQKPIKYKTSVEVVPVPLAYIAPPPLQKYQSVKTVRHIHTFVPTKAKLIVRPIVHVSSPVKIRSVRVPSKLVYKVPITARGGPARSDFRETEPITLRPPAFPATKPPKL